MPTLAENYPEKEIWHKFDNTLTFDYDEGNECEYATGISTFYEFLPVFEKPFNLAYQLRQAQLKLTGQI